MIGESSGVGTLLNNERIIRENQGVPENSSAPAQEEQSQEQTVSDVSQFSAEALALSREVVAAGQTREEGATEQQGRGQEGEPTLPGNILDLRI